MPFSRFTDMAIAGVSSRSARVFGAVSDLPSPPQAGCLLFSLYIVYDTHMLLKRLHVDDWVYVVVAIALERSFR